MKPSFLAVLLFLLLARSARAQNVGIGTTTPAASSELDIRSSTRGLLIPRLSTAERTALQSPAVGLMVFDSTVNAFYYCSAAATWTRVGDNLGSHTASQNINTNGYTISNNGGAAGLSLDNNGNATVTGKVTASGGAAIGNTGAGSYDYLTQGTNGNVSSRKGFGAQSIRYIIAVGGAFPSSNGTYYDVTILGEIKLFAGMGQVPGGWMLCEGQLLNISQNQALYALLGNNYGGVPQQNTFALPDLRGTAPVGPGTSPGGYSWSIGQRTN